MKQKLKILTLTSIACVLVGCGPILTSNQDSVKERRYDNGQLAIQATYSKDNKRDGLTKEWYDNEELKSQGSYKAGVKVGTHKTWYKNGQLASSIDYSDGKKRW